MIKIACCGTHCAGKSTLSYQLAEFYKREKRNVYLIHEAIRESPFPFNEDMCEETAIWTFTSQVSQELSAVEKGYDTLICDRSCFDTFIYADLFDLKKHPLHQFRIAAEEWLESYDFFFFVRPDMPMIKDGIRDEGNVFQMSIDRLFEDFFSHINSDVYREIFTSQIHNRKVDFGDIFSSI